MNKLLKWLFGSKELIVFVVVEWPSHEYVDVYKSMDDAKRDLDFYIVATLPAGTLVETECGKYLVKLIKL